jgi:predicted heme/steroid binding protein
MTLQELAQFDGMEGRKAYVAVNGTIYDLTESERWQNGNHEGAHQAGVDLTEAIKAAPHVRSVIEKFPVVGNVEQDPLAPKKNWSLGGTLLVAAVIAAVVLYMLMR